MSRVIKVVGLTLVTVVGVVLIAIAVLLNCIVTPSRLTPVVRQVADKFITCDFELGEVDLTFFSTFPDFGLRIRNVRLLHPFEGADSDTLASVAELVATVDIKKYIDANILHIKELRLIDAMGNVFIDELGKNNFSVFDVASDSVEVEVADSVSFSLPFDGLYVDELVLKTYRLSFVNKRDSIACSVDGIDLRANVNDLSDIALHCLLYDMKADIGGERYAEKVSVGVDTHLGVDLDSLHFLIKDAVLRVDEFTLAVSGELSLLRNIEMNIAVALSDWQVSHVLRLVPHRFLPSILSPDSLSFDCILSAKAHVYGTMGDSVYPMVDAHVDVREGKARYYAIPLEFKGILLSSDAHIDLNDKGGRSSVKINTFAASTRGSHVSLRGSVEDVLGNMLLDIHMRPNVQIEDFAMYIPQGVGVSGSVSGQLDAKIRLSDITSLRLDRGVIVGGLGVRGLDVEMDSMRVVVPQSQIDFRIPNLKSLNKKSQWLGLVLSFDSLYVEKSDAVAVTMGGGEIGLELNDLLRSKTMLYGRVSLETKSKILAKMDSIGGTIVSPSLLTSFEYNMRDSTVLPIADVRLAFADLQGDVYDNWVHLWRSSLAFGIQPSKRDEHVPQIQASISSDAIKARIGKDMRIGTKAITLDAKSRYNKNGENILTQLRPKLQVDLQDGVIDMSSFGEQIKIPNINFSYSNREFDIANSRVIIGHSDFSLKGNIKHIGRWLQKQDTLEGVLHFTSDSTDVNELMALCSADEGSEEVKQTKKDKSEAVDEKRDSANKTDGPFLVPTDVNLTLNTTISNAKIFKEDVKDIGGRLYIQNGKLVLEEMGFVCKAAKLQLTAMYRTPRKDDIYVGFDYHMLDVDIGELISLIPQLDTMLPMLQSFRGLAEFHLAGETYVNDKYEIKPSTIRGACSLFGKDLVVLDSETFSEISRLLRFKKKTENKIDSISAEVTIYKKDIDIYPFCVSMDKYMVAIGGYHSLDRNYNYHINALSPIYLGVDVNGDGDNLKIKLGKCVYAKDFRPIFHRKTESEALEMRNIIRKSMQRNVKIQYDGVRNK